MSATQKAMLDTVLERIVFGIIAVLAGALVIAVSGCIETKGKASAAPDLDPAKVALALAAPSPSAVPLKADAPFKAGDDDKNKTNYVSQSVSIKGWERNYVMIDEEGNLHDPGDKLIGYKRGEQMASDMEHNYTELVKGTNELRTALNHLYDITNNIPKELVYIAGYEDMSVNANVSNIWGYIVSNFYDKERRRDTFYLYITQNVTNQPAISFRYAAQSTTNWVQGTFVDWPNKTPISDGNELIDCYVCTATRPTAYRNVVVKVNTWLAFGGQTGFLWNGLVVFNDDELTHTGIHTNGDWEIVVDNGGVKSAIKTTTE